MTAKSPAYHDHPAQRLLLNFPDTIGKGAPILSYSWGQNGSGPSGAAPGGTRDIAQFAPVFQPSGGLFAPGYPLVPVERERLRIYNFPTGVNYIYTPRSFEEIGFPELKALARDDITRLCSETRKDQIEKLQWSIKPRNEKDAARNAETRIQQLSEFWAYPDGITPFATRLRMLMEQVLVADCPALEPRRNRGGDLIGFDVIDGSTIKVLIDDTGRRPRPPRQRFVAHAGGAQRDGVARLYVDTTIGSGPQMRAGSEGAGLPHATQGNCRTKARCCTRRRRSGGRLWRAIGRGMRGAGIVLEIAGGSHPCTG